MESTNYSSKNQSCMMRRNFLRNATGLALAPAVVGALGSPSAMAASQGANTELSAPRGELVATLKRDTTRRLHLINEHTGDEVDAIYCVEGIHLNETLAKFNNLMRDRRANKSIAMDIHLYDQLYCLSQQLGTNEPIHVLSGYRTENTNAKLRKRSKGVAKYSLHMKGQAADIYIPGYSAKKVQQTAIELGAGGVGLYSGLNFVHVDTGHVRYWRG